MIKRTICFSTLALLLLLAFSCGGESVAQAQLGARAVEAMSVDGLEFKDLNRNGALDAYEDWRLPVDERIADLVSQMTLEEKVGLMLHPNIAVREDGVIPDENTPAAAPAGRGEGGAAGRGGEAPGGGEMAPGQVPRDAPTPKVYVAERNIRNILNNGVAEPSVFANWSNGMQEIAEATRLGIPIMFSSDPRHGATLGAHVRGTQYFSQWPSREGQFGLASSRDVELARELGRVTAEEYRAVGLHMNLGPQIDLTTEPRWGRNAGCFGEDAELTAEMVSAYIDGAQGEQLGPTSIIAMIKHWPGSGPHQDGEGRQLVYPGDNFDYHLIPWQAAFDAGAMTVMGYYSGTPFDDGLGVNYSSYIMTDVLRDKLGFDGVVCTDWGVISRTGPLREDLVDMPVKDRFKMSIEAGVDQFGSERDPTPIIELVQEGQIPEERIDAAASRILRWHFGLGLFENPYVDPEAAQRIVRSDQNQERGYEAQLKSIVLLANDGTLPMAETVEERPARIYVEGVDPEVAGEYAEVVAQPADADLAVLRVSSVSDGFRPGAESEEVSIEFPSETMAQISSVAASGVPTVVIVNLGSTLVVLPKDLVSNTNATLMAFDVLDAPLLEVIFGRFNPVGRLPFELPSSMEAVRNQLEDVPYDSEDPLFAYGAGLSYPEN